MSKKLLLSLIILIIISGFVFSQEQAKAKNAITFSINIIGAEVNYERMFGRHLSVLADASARTLVFINEFTVSGKGRWYPFGGAFYMEMGLGYIYGNGLLGFTRDSTVAVLALIFFPMIPLMDIDYEFLKKSGGLLVQPGMGWKIDIGKPNGFILPIGMGINFKIGEDPDFLPYLRIGLGYAF